MKQVNPGAAYAQLYTSFCDIENIPYPEWEEFKDRSQVDHLKKDEFLVAPNQSSTHAYFIIEGLVVGYRESGADKFVHFIRSTNDFICSHDHQGFRFNKNGQIASEIFIATEDTIVISILFEDLKWLINNFPGFEAKIRSCFIKNTNIFTQRDDLVPISPKERYLKLQRVTDFRLDRAPDVYLASYLSMTLRELTSVKVSYGIDG